MSSANVAQITESTLSTNSISMSQLYSAYHDRACRYARWMLGNERDSEDVVQDAFVRLTRREQNGKPLESEQQFAGLLFTTVRNLSIDLLRQQGRRQQVSLTAIAEPTAKPAEGSATQLNTTLTKLIEQLPRQWAEALKLKTVGELSYQEIADVMECTRAQVRTWIFRARRQLEQKLKQSGWLDNEV